MFQMNFNVKKILINIIFVLGLFNYLTLKVVWSVARISSQSNEYVRFPVVLVNEGAAWNLSSNKAVIPRDGYYFINVGSGVHSYRITYLNVMVNNKMALSAAHESVLNGIETMSRSGILKLLEGDELRVYVSGYSYSDKQMQTIFIGFLL